MRLRQCTWKYLSVCLHRDVQLWSCCRWSGIRRNTRDCLYSTLHAFTSESVLWFVCDLRHRGSEWLVSCHSYFTSEERGPGGNWMGGCVGPWAGLDVITKIKLSVPHRECNPNSLDIDFWSQVTVLTKLSQPVVVWEIFWLVMISSWVSYCWW